MSNAISILLQPQRSAGESYDKYKERRKSGQDYVASARAGTLFWNTMSSGTYFNTNRANRPNGKSGHRKAKAIARLARAKVAKGELEVA